MRKLKKKRLFSKKNKDINSKKKNYEKLKYNA